MGRRFQRHLGAIHELSPGQFMADPEIASTLMEQIVLVCCPVCGGITPLDGYQIDVAGRVTPRWECPLACPYREWLELESWNN